MRLLRGGASRDLATCLTPGRAEAAFDGCWRCLTDQPPHAFDANLVPGRRTAWSLS